MYIAAPASFRGNFVAVAKDTVVFNSIEECQTALHGGSIGLAVAVWDRPAVTEITGEDAEKTVRTEKADLLVTRHYSGATLTLHEEYLAELTVA
jgi:hypothetical protein